MSACRRCDFRTSPDTEQTPAEQMAEHALATSHHLCPVCSTSLDDTDPVHACERCLSKAREDLAGILLMFAELPDHLGHPRSPTYDTDRPSAADGHPLPGGDALVLLGPGSEGLSEDGHTSKDGDVSSVAFELGWWEKDWRETRDDPDPGPPLSTAATVRHAAGYLEVHARWAATSHPGFPEFADDLRRIHATLEQATGRSERRIVAEAGCMSCGGVLVREVRPRKSEAEPLRKGTEDEGYQSGYTCQNKGCGRVYHIPPEPAEGFNEYAWALKSHLEDHPQEWAPSDFICKWHPVTPELLRQWKKRQQVATAVRYGVTLYRVADVVARLEARTA
jgi:hypothetical protein